MSDSERKDIEPGAAEKAENLYPVSASGNPRRRWWKLGGKDISFSTVDSDSVATSNSGSVNENVEASGTSNVHGSVFNDSGAAQFYQPIEKYEGRHRFDPKATWTDEEERKLIRTVQPSTMTCTHGLA